MAGDFFSEVKQHAVLCFILCGFFLISYSGTAQKFDAGIIVGVSPSQVDGDNLSGFNKVGIKAGGFVKRKFSDDWALQFELEYIQKGSRRPVNTDDNSYYLLRLNYVEAPFMLSYFVNKKLSVEAGLSLGVLISYYEEDETGIPYNSDFHKYDFLGNGGINYMLSEHLSVGVRFSYSLVPIRLYGDEAPYYYFNRNQFNNVLAFSLQYQF